MLFYLWKRNNSYYYRIRVPSDLSDLFPYDLIRISLKTKDAAAAKISAVNVNKKVQNSFALLRSGAVDADTTSSLIEAILPKRKQFKVVEMEGEAKSSPTLAQMIHAYIADRSPHWTEKTKMEFCSQYEVLKKILGDKSVNNYSRGDLIACRDALTKLPTNFTKKREFNAIPITELCKQSWCETLKPRSVNTYISLLSSLFKWMSQNGYIVSNIATGLMLPIDASPDEERKAYALEDIQRIKLNLPRGKDHPERYWIPMIAMYQGFRLDEACQLHLEDVIEVDGIICFDINDAGERNVKTKSSRRVVPIHPKLIELGLLVYIDSCRSSGQVQLWDNIKPDKLGDWGKAFGNWYGRFNRKFVTSDKKKVFHSFRHLVLDSLKQKGVQEGITEEIAGHANQSVTSGRYGKRFRPGVLLEALLKLDY